MRVTRANTNIPLTMLRYSQGMDLQTSPFPAFRGRDRLIAAVDAAMTSGDAGRITADLQLALQEAITDSRIELPECVHRPVSDHYARRPLYHSREHGYSVIAMSWGPGQGTPLHDHDAMWCVEGVWLGELEITRYELLERAGERWRFRRHAALRGGCGSAGSLIPPHEYHTLRNASDDAWPFRCTCTKRRWSVRRCSTRSVATGTSAASRRCRPTRPDRGRAGAPAPSQRVASCAAALPYPAAIRDAPSGKEQDHVQR
jgi:hypothetical protein